MLNDKQIAYAIIELFNNHIEKYNNNASNYFIRSIGSIITTYITLSHDENGNSQYKIDSEGIILALEDNFIDKETSMKNSHLGFELLLDIGINHSSFLKRSSRDNIELNEGTFSFISEKIGFRILFHDWGYTHSQRPMEWYRFRGNNYRWIEPPSDPLIDDIYALFYVSGIVYNIVDVKTEDNLDGVILGAGFGITFFNDLKFNVSWAVPTFGKVVKPENGFLNIGFDFPIVEYFSE